MMKQRTTLHKINKGRVNFGYVINLENKLEEKDREIEKLKNKYKNLIAKQRVKTRNSNQELRRLKKALQEEQAEVEALDKSKQRVTYTQTIICEIIDKINPTLRKKIRKEHEARNMILFNKNKAFIWNSFSKNENNIKRFKNFKSLKWTKQLNIINKYMIKDEKLIVKKPEHPDMGLLEYSLFIWLSLAILLLFSYFVIKSDLLSNFDYFFKKVTVVCLDIFILLTFVVLILNLFHKKIKKEKVYN